MSNEVANAVTETAEIVAKSAAPAQTAVNTASKLFFKGAGKVKRFSPQILLVVGVAGVTTAAVLAAKATLKLEDVIDKAEDEAAKVKEAHKLDEFENETAYTKALSKVYVTRALEVGKLYIPAVSVGVVGIGCLMGSHGIMSQRNASAIAAYKAIETGFMQYRGRVIDQLGEDKDKEFRFGLVEKEIPEFDAEGTQTGTKTVVDVQNPLGAAYARCYDESNDNWSKIPGQNQMELSNQQNWLNDRLNARGYVFLNDVYKALGFAATPEGQVVGWLAKSHKNFDPKTMDGYIDFGLFDIENEAKRNFINGFERSCWLDFNVDGVMYNLL